MMDIIGVILFVLFWVVMIAIWVVPLAFWVWMLVDVIKYQEKDRVMWILIVLLASVLGAIIYFFTARKERKKEKGVK